MDEGGWEFRVGSDEGVDMGVDTDSVDCCVASGTGLEFALESDSGLPQAAINTRAVVRMINKGLNFRIIDK